MTDPYRKPAERPAQPKKGKAHVWILGATGIGLWLVGICVVLPIVGFVVLIAAYGMLHNPPHSPPKAPSVSACEEIFLVDDSGDLSAFKLSSPVIVKLTTLKCAPPADGPYSFAVEESGTLWVGWSGELVKIDPVDGRCTTTPFVPKQHDFGRLDLTFVGGTLWAADDAGWGGDAAPSKGLAHIDGKSLTLTPVGDVLSGSPLLIAGGVGDELIVQATRTLGSVVTSKTPLRFDDVGGKTFEVAKGKGAPMAYAAGYVYFFSETAGVVRAAHGSATLDVVLPPTKQTFVAAGAPACAGHRP
jgi:hypothetical protein